MPPLADAMDAVHLSVDRFCLLAGVEALAEMMEEDATTVCGARHRRHGDRRGYRWGRTHSEIGYHGGKVKVARPRVRDRAGKEVSLESWQALREAQGHVAFTFEYGERAHGITIDHAEALKWYRVIAERGDPSDQFQLGEYYSSGGLGVQDKDEALKWYFQAVKR